MSILLQFPHYLLEFVFTPSALFAEPVDKEFPVRRQNGNHGEQKAGITAQGCVEHYFGSDNSVIVLSFGDLANHLRSSWHGLSSAGRLDRRVGLNYYSFARISRAVASAKNKGQPVIISSGWPFVFAGKAKARRDSIIHTLLRGSLSSSSLLKLMRRSADSSHFVFSLRG
jgi:hypothetical protein